MAAKPQAVNIADPPWRDVTAWANKRLAIHRNTLETRGMSPEDTEGARCAIDELKALLNFPNPSKIPATVSDEAE